MTPTSDHALMLRACADDAAAFEALILRHHAHVVNAFKCLVTRPEFADDQTQDAFLHLFRGRKAYRDDRVFSLWLAEIIDRLAKAHNRESHRIGS